MLEGNTNERENWDYLWGRAEAIREKCVVGLGVGGSAPAGKFKPSSQSPWITRSSIAGDVSDGDPKTIGVYVTGPQSKINQLLDMKYACTPDADGNYSCEDEDLPPAKKQKTSSPSDGGTGASAPPAGNRLSNGAQSGSCTHYKECDYNNGYTCAATKTAAGFPVDASWGTFTCKLASNVASGVVAAVAAYVGLGASCRGRCLLDSNGTFNILANTTATGPEPDSAMAPMLVGPCNCTYVSAACVLSETGIVYEDPSAKINTVLGAPNGSVCCDGTTGLWRQSAVLRDAPAADPICPASSGTGTNGSGSGVIDV